MEKEVGEEGRGQTGTESLLNGPGGRVTAPAVGKGGVEQRLLLLPGSTCCSSSHCHFRVADFARNCLFQLLPKAQCINSIREFSACAVHPPPSSSTPASFLRFSSRADSLRS